MSIAPRFFCAVDLGASSGRVMLGRLQMEPNASIELEEILRFPNELVHKGNHYYWDIYNLRDRMVQGLQLIARRGIAIESIGIDTWGVDVALLDANDQLLCLPFSYRDPHTEGAPERFFERMPRETLYRKTGIEIMNINTVFQLDTLRRTEPELYSQIATILFMPNALSFLLTGKKVTEYSIASTGALINAHTQTWDPDILELLGLTPAHFGSLVYAGTKVGTLTPALQQETGLGPVPVMAVAGHDTASAVAAVPARGAHFAYLSSGTWSLMGVEREQPIINDRSFSSNFTNEGGVDGTVRFLKNICGMWILERCMSEWTDKLSYSQIVEAAQACYQGPNHPIIDPQDPCFAHPEKMIPTLQQACRQTGQYVPTSPGEIALCIFESLAATYARVMDTLQALCSEGPEGYKIEELYIMGGGSKNHFLNQLTANATGLPVYTGLVEATAVGNVVMQALACGHLVPAEGQSRRQALRSVVRESLGETRAFMPQ